MLQTTIKLLKQFETSNSFDADSVLSKLRSIGLTEFALVTNAMSPHDYPSLSKYVPTRTADDVQLLFTGATDTELLKQSIDFVRHFFSQVAMYQTSLIETHDNTAKILDYGCGWGRLLRLVPFYFSPNNLFGVDPWDRALIECEKAGINSPTQLSERDASDLAGMKFNAGYSFSVFTHLPESLAKSVLKNLSQCFPRDGIFVITVRPPEYWDIRIEHATTEKHNPEIFQKAIDTHYAHGFSYIPHGGQTGEYYGDASMTTEWIESNIPEWRIISQERSLSDPAQIYLTLAKK